MSTYDQWKLDNAEDGCGCTEYHLCPEHEQEALENEADRE